MMAANAKKAEAQAAKDAVKAKEQEKKDAAAWAVGSNQRGASKAQAAADKQAEKMRRDAEKKALVSLLGANASKLELSVNFHMCVDCHAFIKAASVLLQRPIVCREPKMVHHFSGGVCSCGDRWRWEARAVRRTK